jgi:hypothetical protein
MAQTSLVQHGEKEITTQPTSAGTMGMIERAVSDPNFNAENFKTLVEFRDRELARNAQDAFNAAMAAAQGEMRPIEADANNPQTRSRYATYAKLDKALRPVYNKHGFGLSFNTVDSPIVDHMRVLCYVSHIAGHTRTYQIDIPTDGKGAKGNDVMTKTHAVGAGASYAMRYLLKMIFNVLVGEDDWDGNNIEAQAVDPTGFTDWWTDLAAVADQGLKAYSEAWKESADDFRRHAIKHYGKAHEERKRIAAKVDA